MNFPKVAVDFKLKLYVAGTSAKSERAKSNLDRIIAAHFKGEVDVEIVDLLLKPRRAREDQIVAIPTLVRSNPPPRTQVIGDLSNTDKVLSGIGVGFTSL